MTLASGMTAGKRRLLVNWDDPQDDVVTEAADVLGAGGTVVLPTDTVLGIAQSVDACPEGAQQIYLVKKRDPAKPLAWLVPGKEALAWYGRDLPAWCLALADAFWPGALTLVVRASDNVPPCYRGERETIGLRMPAAPLAIAISRRLGCALATTSANTSGLPAPSCSRELEDRIASLADLVIDDGLRHCGVASTVIDCTGSEPRVIRQGAISADDIARVIGTSCR